MQFDNVFNYRNLLYAAHTQVSFQDEFVTKIFLVYFLKGLITFFKKRQCFLEERKIQLKINFAFTKVLTQYQSNVLEGMHCKQSRILLRIFPCPLRQTLMHAKVFYNTIPLAIWGFPWWSYITFQTFIRKYLFGNS